MRASWRTSLIRPGKSRGVRRFPAHSWPRSMCAIGSDVAIAGDGLSRRSSWSCSVASIRSCSRSIAIGRADGPTPRSSPVAPFSTPDSQGGDWAAKDNLLTACWPCNAVKGDLSLEQLGWTMRAGQVDGWDGLVGDYQRLWVAAGRPNPRLHAACIKAFEDAPRRGDGGAAMTASSPAANLTPPRTGRSRRWHVAAARGGAHSARKGEHRFVSRQVSPHLNGGPDDQAIASVAEQSCGARPFGRSCRRRWDRANRGGRRCGSDRPRRFACMPCG